MSFSCRQLSTATFPRILSLASGLRHYSHGATIAEVYASYRRVDEHLRRTRPDLINDSAKIDELQSRGEITPLMAAYFKKDIAHALEAKSLSNLGCQYLGLTH